MPEKLPNVDTEKQKKRQDWVAKHRAPDLETKVQAPPKIGRGELSKDASKEKKDGGSNVREQKRVEPLDSGIRKQLEQSFGVPLGDILVATGPSADKECEERGALAFTVGNVITLSSKIKKGTPEYIETLGHECAHVIQQDAVKAKGKEAKGQDQKENKGRQGKGKDEKPKDKEKKEAKSDNKSAENEAKGAEKKVANKESVNVKEKVSKGTEQHQEDRWESPTKIIIPLPGGKSIEINPPSGKHKTWKVAVPEVKTLGEPKEKEVRKVLAKNIPTPFFGLALHLGIEFGAKAECKAIPIGPIEVEYDSQTGQATVNAKASAMMGVSVWAAFRAGVAGDLWVVEAGVGLKAKLVASLEKKVEGGVSFGYNVKKGGMPSFGISLDLTALEIALKGAVALFCYFDAIGISTYEKEWTLYERTLGKLTIAGVKFSWSTSEGGKIEPKAMDIQNLEGNISSLFPKKSR